MMTFAKEGNQWLVVREFGWNIDAKFSAGNPKLRAACFNKNNNINNDINKKNINNNIDNDINSNNL